jgi:hypothetical protein
VSVCVYGVSSVSQARWDSQPRPAPSPKDSSMLASSDYRRFRTAAHSNTPNVAAAAVAVVADGCASATAPSYTDASATGSTEGSAGQAAGPADCPSHRIYGAWFWAARIPRETATGFCWFGQSSGARRYRRLSPLYCGY